MQHVEKTVGTQIASHHAMRGIAATLVVIYHFKDIDQARHLDSMTAFFGLGYLWVDFFFILSGFILSHVYKQRLTRASSQGIPSIKSAVESFYIARIARIYPLHLFTLFALLALELSAYVFHQNAANAFVDEKKSVSSFLLNLILVHGWGVFGVPTSWNVPSWSISTEAACYALFPLSILLLKAVRPKLSGIATLSISASFYFLIFKNHASVEDASPLIRCFAGFIGGMGLSSLASSRNFKSLPIVFINSLQLLSMAGVIVTMHYAGAQAIIILLFSVLIISTSTDRGIVATMLSNRILLVLGTLSYSIYLDHWLIYRAYWIYGNDIFGALASNYSQGNITALKFVTLFSAVIAIAYATFHWIEVPARAYINAIFLRFSKKTQSASVAPHVT